jgi:hypothetical protein
LEPAEAGGCMRIQGGAPSDQKCGHIVRTLVEHA